MREPHCEHRAAGAVRGSMQGLQEKNCDLLSAVNELGTRIAVSHQHSGTTKHGTCRAQVTLHISC